MNYNAPVNVAPVKVEEPRMPLYEQLNQTRGMVENICLETSKLLNFVCAREVEPYELQGKDLSAQLSWMYNALGVCVNALRDVNEVVK